jgi:hypothetical protein
MPLTAVFLRGILPEKIKPPRQSNSARLVAGRHRLMEGASAVLGKAK